MSVTRGQVEEKWRQLESVTSRLWGELEAMSEGQRRFRPATGGWSPLQVGQHLLIAESQILESLRSRLGNPERWSPARPSLGDRLKHLLVHLTLVTGAIKVRAPSPALAQPPEPATLAELLDGWRASRGSMAELVTRIPDGELGYMVVRHPIAGPLDAASTLRFMAEHVEHHLRQVGRIKAADGFAAA